MSKLITGDKRKRYDKIVIAFDQSYTATGVSVAGDGKLLKVTSTQYKGLSTKSEKRNHIRDICTKLINKATQMASEVVILVERIRTFNAGGKGKDKGTISPTYLKMTGALIAVIVDVAALKDIPVFSVDTRAWKSKIVGSSKAKKDKDGNRDSKSETVQYVEKLGFSMFIRAKKNGKNKGDPIYDDDAADSACIALYGFIPKKQQKLVLEE